jgi:hypothetical protein
LWVVFQAAFLVAAPVAHAALDARLSTATHHVESPTERPCAPGHDEFTCQLCRIAVFHGPTPVLWVAAVAQSELWAPILVAAHESQSGLTLPDSRAPPARL